MHPSTDIQRYSTLVDREGPRLIRLCARITGDADAAEDLAQETLLIAWRLRARINDWQQLAPWLSAIARNVCRHWLRQQRRTPAIDQVPADDALGRAVADPFDLEVALERAELAELLDRALELLPAPTRDVLVQKYIDQSPHAEIAARMGLTPNAVTVRLHRGRLAFQRVLNTTLRDDAAALGIAAGSEGRRTQLWCPICGEQHLIGVFDSQRGQLKLRCPGCSPADTAGLWTCDSSDQIKGIKSVRKAIFTSMEQCFEFYQAAAAAREVQCQHCQRTVPLVFALPSCTQPPYPSRHGMHVLCAGCDSGQSVSLRMFVQSSPPVRQFWREHPKTHTLPPRQIERDGTTAIITRFQSMTDQAHIDVVTTSDTYAILHIAQNN